MKPELDEQEGRVKGERWFCRGFLKRGVRQILEHQGAGEDFGKVGKLSQQQGCGVRSLWCLLVLWPISQQCQCSYVLTVSVSDIRPLFYYKIKEILS